MKISNLIAFLAIPLISGCFLSSCSRSSMPMSSAGRLMNRQALAVKNPTSTAKLLAEKTVACVPETIVGEQIANVSSGTVKASAEEGKPALVKKSRFAAKVPKMASALFANTVQTVNHDVAVVNNLFAKQGTASYSGTQHTEGFLGIAGICLIVAICLGVLGFTSGRLFWELGVILIVAAVVFFLLYLINKAAGPSAP